MGPEGFIKIKDAMTDANVSAMVANGALMPFQQGENVEYVTVSATNGNSAPHARILNALGEAGYIYREDAPDDGSSSDPALEPVISTERSITFRDRNYPTSL